MDESFLGVKTGTANCTAMHRRNISHTFPKFWGLVWWSSSYTRVCLWFHRSVDCAAPKTFLQLHQRGVQLAQPHLQNCHTHSSLPTGAFSRAGKENHIFRALVYLSLMSMPQKSLCRRLSTGDFPRASLFVTIAATSSWTKSPWTALQ